MITDCFDGPFFNACIHGRNNPPLVVNLSDALKEAFAGLIWIMLTMEYRR